MDIVNDFIYDMFQKLAQEASTLCKADGRITLGTKDIEAAVKLNLSDELAHYAILTARKALLTYNKSL